MICKKCHKRIIDIIKTNFDLRNRCKCDGRRYAYIRGEKAEILGIESGSKVASKSHKLR